MSNVKRILPVLLCIVALISCQHNLKNTDITPSGKKIDLFTQTPALKNAVFDKIIVYPDTALKYSALSGKATNLALIDSSVNGRYYLYTAVMENIKKQVAKKRLNGKRKFRTKEMKKPGQKIYFIADKKFNLFQSITEYMLYLVPLRNHNIVRFNLYIKWQWYTDAPLLSVSK